MNEKYRQNNAPKMYDFLFNFLGLDYNAVDKTWRNDGVAHMHFGLRGKPSHPVQKSYGIVNTQYLGVSPTVQMVDGVVDSSITKLNNDLIGVDRIDVELIRGYVFNTGKEISSPPYDTQAQALTALEALAPSIPMSVMKGFNKNKNNVWKT